MVKDVFRVSVFVLLLIHGILDAMNNRNPYVAAPDQRRNEELYQVSDADVARGKALRAEEVSKGQKVLNKIYASGFLAPIFPAIGWGAGYFLKRDTTAAALWGGLGSLLCVGTAVTIGLKNWGTIAKGCNRNYSSQRDMEQHGFDVLDVIGVSLWHWSKGAVMGGGVLASGAMGLLFYSRLKRNS